jgi:hypothetical protein
MHTRHTPRQLARLQFKLGDHAVLVHEEEAEGGEGVAVGGLVELKDVELPAAVGKGKDVFCSVKQELIHDDTHMPLIGVL